MDNLATTYQHIADILSFEIPKIELEERLGQPAFNWDAIVVEGSKHLVLPAIYCRLRSKNLLHTLPNELKEYLEELTLLNRKRNLSIIEQVHSISDLFNKLNINHVFLKGSALLISETFDDIAERMVGDIDILVDNKQLDTAFNLLETHGYQPIPQTLGNTFFEHKHLPRLKTDIHISAVELHRKLFVSYNDKDLSSTTVLTKKQLVNKVYIPKNEHLLRHNILNYQINDNGKLYNSISFRSAYDSICLMRHKTMAIDIYEGKIFKTYFNILGLFFDGLDHTIQSKRNFLTSFYIFKLKHIKFYKLWNKFLNFCNFSSILLKRIPYFVTNSGYRKALFNDRKRVFDYFMSVLKNK